MKNLGVLFCAISLVMMTGIMVVSFTELAEADADELIKVKNNISVYDVGGAYCANLSGPVTSYEPVVYNGYGHYYNYHIMGNSGHNNGHGNIIKSTVVFDTTIQVDSCN